MSIPLHLFEAFGVEIEYMIVERDSLRVAPICDRLLAAAARLPGAVPGFEGGSEVPTEVALGEISWSNELVAHLVEFKTTDPAPSLAELPDRFQRSVTLANDLLAPMGAMLLPSAMHPTMDPARHTVIWPHGHSEVYETFNRIFDCRGHGWANLQAAHLNLPFSGDDEFGRLHGALRALLPIMPALAASSPVIEGRSSGFMDTRMEVYRTNAARVPSVAGLVVPEPVFTEAEYRSEILARIHHDLAPLDPEGVLRHEWCNSRGCIARFTRSSIEVRVLDAQECPAADLAIMAAISAVARDIAGRTRGSLDRLNGIDTRRLNAILLAVVRDAEATPLTDSEYLDALGLDSTTQLTAGMAWDRLISSSAPSLRQLDPWKEPLKMILTRGTLARRVARALGDEPGLERIAEIYGRLARALASGVPFDGLGRAP